MRGGSARDPLPPSQTNTVSRRVRTARSALRAVLPASVRTTLYKLRRLGFRKFLSYRRLERDRRALPAPSAGRLFEIGSGRAITLHESTVAAVRSHWVDYGQSIKELDAFRRLAPEARVFFDIGAAEGIFSAAFCALTRNPAWAFEPSPEMFERLNALSAANPDFEIHPFNHGLGDGGVQRGVAQFADGQFSGATAEVSTDVMAIQPLDAFVAEHGVTPDFVKIDVEGMELDVLRGGRETFRDSVTSLILEVHGHGLQQLGESVGAVDQFLIELGFVLHSLDFEPIERLEQFMADDRELVPGYTIVVCCKR
jgi:FkbM family methyltransferase